MPKLRIVIEKDRFREIAEKMRPALQQIKRQNAERVAELAKQNAPVLSGELRDSIKVFEKGRDVMVLGCVLCGMAGIRSAAASPAGRALYGPGQGCGVSAMAGGFGRYGGEIQMSAGQELMAVAEWLYARLTADATLGGLVGTRVYADLAPESAAFPMVVFQFQTGEDVDAAGGIRVLANTEWLIRGIDMTPSYRGAWRRGWIACCTRPAARPRVGR